MRRYLLLLLVSLLSMVANAVVEIGGIYYNFSGDKATVTSGDNKYTGAVVIPKSVIHNDITYSVTSIGKEAFYGCSGLTSVTIPNSVTSIGDYAFSGCSGLTSVTIPESVTWIGYGAFYDCNNLTSITIPNSVTRIGSATFHGCSGLTIITIPNSVTSIGSSAFYGCSGLTSVTIPESVTWIGDNAFRGCRGLTSVTIPNSVTSIGDNAFRGCRGLTSITIPNSVTSIGSGAFSGCSSLTIVMLESNAIVSATRTSRTSLKTVFGEQVKEYVIGEGVVSIGDYAFYGCSSLTSFTIDNSVTSIGNGAFNGTAWYNNQPDGLVYAGKFAYKYKGTMSVGTRIDIAEGTLGIACSAFAGCSGLTSVTIPKSVTCIGSSAFYNCRDLTSVTIDNGVTDIGSYAFSNCRGLTTITIPESVINIGSSAFYDCRGLTSVTIGNSVTCIGSYAFYNCSGLTSVTIGNGVTSIGVGTFYGCSGLISIIIGNGVTNIGSSAFSGCSGVKVVKCLAKKVPETGNNVFSDIASMRLLVSGELVDMYKVTSPWKEFGMIMAIEDADSKIQFADAKVKAICVANWDIDDDGELTEFEAAMVYSLGQAFKNSVITSFNELQYFRGLTSICEQAFSGCSSLTSVTIPNSITNIGEGAFSGCRRLTSITIPNSVTSIGENGFFGCSGLTKVIVPDVAAWCSMGFGNEDSNPLCYAHRLFGNEETEITNLIIPDGITGICGYAFSGCSGLTSITIPKSVTSIGENAFSGCSGLTKVVMSDIVAWCGIEFGNYYSNPLCYAHHLFKDETTEIIDLILLNGVTGIGAFAFSGCSGLTSVTIGNKVTSIGSSAFSGCSGLKFVRCYAKNVPETGNDVFSDIASIRLLVLGDVIDLYKATSPWKEFGTIMAIEDADSKIQFADAKVKAICVANWDIDGNGEISEFEASVVTGIGEKFKESEITSFDELQYFTGLTSISNQAFYVCSSLTSVTIPESVTSIGNCAFQYCNNLPHVTIPNSVSSIGEQAFSGCRGLTSVTIGSGVTSIGKDAFYRCNLKKVVVPDIAAWCGIKFEGSTSNPLYYAHHLFKDETTEITDLVIPEGVTSIGNEVFQYCNNLTSITIPNSVTSIGSYAFSGCI